MADVYLPYVVNVRSAYANALDFSPRDFATWNFTSPWVFHPIRLKAPGRLTLGSAPIF